MSYLECLKILEDAGDGLRPNATSVCCLLPQDSSYLSIILFWILSYSLPTLVDKLQPNKKHHITQSTPTKQKIYKNFHKEKDSIRNAFLYFQTVLL